MNHIKNIPALLIVSVLLSVPLHAQIARSTSRVGTTAAQFLKIGAGARALGLGGAFVAVEGDINSVYWNPAGIARIANNGSATFNHADWLAGMNYDFVAAALHVGDLGTLALNVVSFGVPEDIVRTLQNEQGDGRRFDASSVAFGLSYARNLTDRFSMGVTVKYINERIWNEKASGFALDVGTLFITPFNDLKIGASMSNFGSKMQLSGRDLLFNFDPQPTVDGGTENIPSQYRIGEYDIPLTFRVGVAMDVIQYEGIKATAVLDATHPNDNTEYIGTGVEVGYRNTIYARVGYKSLFLRDSEQKLTWGVGFQYEFSATAALAIDYGFADYGRLQNVQFLSVAIHY